MILFKINIYLEIVVFNLFLLIFFIQILNIRAHGRLLKPISRGSRYNDNEGFCGGFTKQWIINNGKCGLCGNDYRDKIPRMHELGGKYGNGVIVENYKVDSEIEVAVYITANHKGFFMFDLCNVDNNHESEECFAQYALKLMNGEYKYYLEHTLNGWFNTTIKIPNELFCNHCVFRWTYTTGNSWGTCSDGTQAVGCGAQETFKGCSDISIKK